VASLFVPKLALSEKHIKFQDKTDSTDEEDHQDDDFFMGEVARGEKQKAEEMAGSTLIAPSLWDWLLVWRLFGVRLTLPS
jgi:hypothetical protein